jgi:hypothetical protein
MNPGLRQLEEWIEQPKTEQINDSRSWDFLAAEHRDEIRSAA